MFKYRRIARETLVESLRDVCAVSGVEAGILNGFRCNAEQC